jgi:hypothetical protein
MSGSDRKKGLQGFDFPDRSGMLCGPFGFAGIFVLCEPFKELGFADRLADQSRMHKHDSMEGTYIQLDSSTRKVGSRYLSLKQHIQLSGGTLKMETSHPAKEIGGETFTGGAFLVGKGVLICPWNKPLIVDFGGLFLWPCINKSGISREKRRNRNMETLAVVGRLLGNTMRIRGRYQQQKQ